ncbi:MAG: hypothetical protein CL843_12450 [Crocinitomicaceae bacterium]|nr:hypothetical protein [Crocinitomicaceae bacterium]|tara:strand:+ start:4477 stop:4770 length:294 start_codon:yes stop_codon:yes gene_type:complete
MEEVGQFGNSAIGHVDKLIALHKSAVSEVKRLKEENKFLTEKLTHSESKNQQLIAQNKTLEIAKNVDGGSSENTIALKRRINELVKEVDECIALLNK